MSESDEKVIQTAQKCAWCGEYLLGSQLIATYNGPDKRFSEWLVHESCNLPPDDEYYESDQTTDQK
jgi:hypothetical protein